MYDFVDLFSGIGGMRIGFEKAGARCVFSSEIDQPARDTYLENFGDEPHGDIRMIEADQLPRHDILLAGFPCQPFSIAGVSKLGSMGREHGFLDKTKGTLFFDICRILQHHKPRAFLLENVKGLLWHDEGRTFETILTALKDLGYTVSHQVVNSVAFVPQRRERIFIVGFSRESDIEFRFPELPEPSRVLVDILEEDVDPKYTLNDHLWNYHRERKRTQKEKGNGFGYRMFEPEDTSGTLSARYYKDGSEILLSQGDGNPRMLTPRECARLMGFPDGFKLNKSEVQAYKQLGNAVVPPVVEAIAKEMVPLITLWTAGDEAGGASIAMAAEVQAD